MKIILKIRSITKLFLGLLLTLICIIGYDLSGWNPAETIFTTIFVYLPALLITSLAYILIIWLFIESFELVVIKK